MKTNLLLLFIILALVTGSYSQTPRNCTQILANNPGASSGVYIIDPDSAGPLPTMNCYCDMTTDGGGWTLVLNYNHLASTSPDLRIMSDSLPLLGSTSVGFDESNTDYWGHADTNLMTALPFDEIRFFGITSAHTRVIDFKTMHSSTVSYFKTGHGSSAGINVDYVPLPGHTAYLPAQTDNYVVDQGNYAMPFVPFYKTSYYHWFIRGFDSSCSIYRWEVNDFPCLTLGIIPSTIHQVWVRGNNATAIADPVANDHNLAIVPNPASDHAMLYIKNFKAGVCVINIYNNMNQLIRSEKVVSNPQTISISDLPNGIYIIQYQSETFTRINRLIVHNK